LSLAPRGSLGKARASRPAGRPAPACLPQAHLDGFAVSSYGHRLIMGRHKGFIGVSLFLCVLGVVAWYFSRTWHGWEYIADIVGKGDNMPIAGLMPIIAFFTYLSLDEAFRHDRLIKQGREDEILDEMYK
jgi:hypothetical protein